MKTTNKKEKNIYKTASQVGKFIKPVGKIALGVIIFPAIKSVSKLIKKWVNCKNAIQSIKTE